MIVIDTSVVLKWFVAEDDSDRATDLIGTPCLAPDLIVAELGNALWKKWRKGEIGRAQAHAALAELPDLVGLMPSPPLAEAALGIAIDVPHPVYDCFFLALAEQSDLVLVTADVRLIDKLAGSRLARYVVALGDHRP